MQYFLIFIILISSYQLDSKVFSKQRIFVCTFGNILSGKLARKGGGDVKIAPITSPMSLFIFREKVDKEFV
jgi:hypothetical protein